MDGLPDGVLLPRLPDQAGTARADGQLVIGVTVGWRLVTVVFGQY